LKYARLFLVSAGVFICCFFVLKMWLNVQLEVAAIAAAVSAAGTVFGAALTLFKTSLEIEKLTHENHKLKREEADATRLVRSPSLAEIDKYGLKPRPFVSDSREERL
jgi:hypothetical protein